MYKFLLLDLDNTLYPRESGLLQRIDRRIDEFIQLKLGLSPEEVTMVRQEYWQRYGTTIEGMLLHHNTNPQEYLEYAYRVDVASFIKPNPELAAMLAGLDLRLAVFSNSPLEYIQRILRRLAIERLIECVYDITFLGYQGKPNPVSYQKVLTDLGVRAEECILIDDTTTNLCGARNAGITPIHLGRTDPAFEWSIAHIGEVAEVITEVIEARKTA
jgi:putative hydrolase of the HAD superfamily